MNLISIINSTWKENNFNESNFDKIKMKSEQLKVASMQYNMTDQGIKLG